jgi:hypothetical protein
MELPPPLKPPGLLARYVPGLPCPPTVTVIDGYGLILLIGMNTSTIAPFPPLLPGVASPPLAPAKSTCIPTAVGGTVNSVETPVYGIITLAAFVVGGTVGVVVGDVGYADGDAEDAPATDIIKDINKAILTHFDINRTSNAAPILSNLSVYSNKIIILHNSRAKIR